MSRYRWHFVGLLTFLAWVALFRLLEHAAPTTPVCRAEDGCAKCYDDGTCVSVGKP